MRRTLDWFFLITAAKKTTVDGTINVVVHPEIKGMTTTNKYHLSQTHETGKQIVKPILTSKTYIATAPLYSPVVIVGNLFTLQMSAKHASIENASGRSTETAKNLENTRSTDTVYYDGS